jgi:hypothetical protein
VDLDGLLVERDEDVRVLAHVEDRVLPAADLEPDVAAADDGLV